MTAFLLVILSSAGVGVGIFGGRLFPGLWFFSRGGGQRGHDNLTEVVAVVLDAIEPAITLQEGA